MPRGGRRVRAGAHGAQVVQSMPRAGATTGRARRNRRYLVSLHAPARGGDRSKEDTPATPPRFNPRPRAGRLSILLPVRPQESCLQSMPPRGDGAGVDRGQQDYVSIHAPRGRRAASLLARHQVVEFQSTPRAGDRRRCDSFRATFHPRRAAIRRMQTVSLRVSIHAARGRRGRSTPVACLRQSQSSPRAACDDRALALVMTRFYASIHAPRGGRPCEPEPHFAMLLFFNPRPARGATCTRCGATYTIEVSINAPRGGRRQGCRRRLGVSRLQSTPRAGATETALLKVERVFNPRPARANVRH